MPLPTYEGQPGPALSAPLPTSLWHSAGVMMQTAQPSPQRPMRRRLLCAAAGAALWPRPGLLRASEGPLSDFNMAAEFDPQEAVWLGHDAGHETLTAQLAAALLPHVTLKLMLRDGAALERASALLRPLGSAARAVQYMVEPAAAFFLRDMAVFASGPAGRLGVVDFRWNDYGMPAWCSRRHAGDAQRVAACSVVTDPRRDGVELAIARHAGASLHQSDLFMEGGGVEVNGRGTLIANAALYASRNPGLTRAQLQQQLLQLPGIRHVVWLPEGLAEDPHLRGTITGRYVAWGTGGHTDEFVRFADPGTVLLAWPDDDEVARHPVARLNRQRMQRNWDVLSRATDQDGRRLKVLKVPLPRTIERPVFLSAAADPAWSTGWSADYFPASEKRRQGDRVIQVASASYLNHVVANGVVVLPGFVQHGTPKARQERVRRVYEQAFPGREIVFIDAISAHWVGGGPHCATLSEPRVRPPP